MITFHQSSKFVRKPKKIKNRRKDLQGCPQKKGTCMQVKVTTPRKPNSALRKIARVVLTNKRFVTAFIPGIKHNLVKHSTVLVRGGRTTDLPGLKYKIVRGAYDLKGIWERSTSRSKYGAKRTR